MKILTLHVTVTGREYKLLKSKAAHTARVFGLRHYGPRQVLEAAANKEMERLQSIFNVAAGKFKGLLPPDTADTLKMGFEKLETPRKSGLVGRRVKGKAAGK